MTDISITAIVDAANKAGAVIDGLRAHVSTLKPQRVRLIALCDQLIAGTITTADAQIAIDKERLIT